MKWTIWISILLLCLTGIGEVQAQNDPVLAGMIAVYTEKAEKELKNQEKVMLMQTTGHIWTKEEVQATTDLQREYPFCEYPFNIILNFSLGGELNGMMTWPGEIHDEDLPGEMWVDWVRVVLLDNNKINE